MTVWKRWFFLVWPFLVSMLNFWGISFPTVTILLLPASWCSSDGLPFGGVLNVDGQSWMNRGTNNTNVEGKKYPEYF